MEANRNKLPQSSLDLLSQIVHPLFAEISEPQVQMISDLKSSDQAFNPYSQDVDSLVTDIAGKIAEQLRSMDDIKDVNASVPYPPELFWAAMAVAMQTVGLESAPRLCLHVSSSVDKRALLEGLRQFKQHASTDVTSGPEWNSLFEKEGYSWIRKDSSSNSCIERLAGAFVTLRVAAQLSSVAEMISGTQLLLPSPPSKIWPDKRMTKVWHSSDGVLDSAAKKARQGYRVVAVNTGSAYQVGGTFLTGGTHALEEAMCTQSTLFLSLQRAQRLAYDCNLVDAKGLPVHIPETGCVLSPNVEIFREGLAHGYAPCEEGSVVLAGVVTVAMPNMNPNALFNPVEWRLRPQREQLIENKMHCMLQAAEMVEADVLVVSDIGCGEFANDPRSIGATLGVVLSRYPGHFRELVICGGQRFFDAVCEGVGPGFLVSHTGKPRKDMDNSSTVSTAASTATDASTAVWNLAKNAAKKYLNTATTNAESQNTQVSTEAVVIGRKDMEEQRVPVAHAVPVPGESVRSVVPSQPLQSSQGTKASQPSAARRTSKSTDSRGPKRASRGEGPPQGPMNAPAPRSSSVPRHGGA